MEHHLILPLLQRGNSWPINVLRQNVDPSALACRPFGHIVPVEKYHTVLGTAKKNSAHGNNGL
jgi:hypothetical protein